VVQERCHSLGHHSNSRQTGLVQGRMSFGVEENLRRSAASVSRLMGGDGARCVCSMVMADDSSMAKFVQGSNSIQWSVLSHMLDLYIPLLYGNARMYNSGAYGWCNLISTAGMRTQE